MIADHESEQELQTVFRLAGISISSDQLRRWRDQGLMPRVSQHGLGRAAGSAVRYPIGTARLALEIDRLLSIKKKVTFVGWQLWMQGYDVADHYWNPAIESAMADLKRLPAFLRLKEIQNINKDETIIDQIDLAIFKNSAFAKGISRLPRNQSVLALGLIADVAQGLFSVNQPQDELEKSTNFITIVKFIGQSSDSIVSWLISNENFEIEINRHLLVLTESMKIIQAKRRNSKIEISREVRRQFLSILQIANQLTSIMPAFGKSPIGRFARSLAQDQAVQAYAVIVWSVFRDQGSILPPEEIAALAKTKAGNSP